MSQLSKWKSEETSYKDQRVFSEYEIKKTFTDGDWPDYLKKLPLLERFYYRNIIIIIMVHL